jgi:hypothetical protein
VEHQQNRVGEGWAGWHATLHFQALPPGSITSRNRQPSEADVVHDHIRLRQHKITAVAYTGISIGPRHVQHPGKTYGGQPVGSSSSSVQLRAGRGSAEMISDGRTDADGKVPVNRVGENLLPTAQA